MACVPLHLLSLLVFLLPISVVAQGNNLIDVGSYLTATDMATPWLSPSRDFAFGFRQVQDKDQFLLSIWFYKIPDRTIVWYGNNGTTVPRGAKVQLTSDRGLVLTYSQGKELWRTDSGGSEVYNGFMNDTGNFEILGSDSSKLWDSFSNPTDTLLPTQTMEINGVLHSRLSETNFTNGRFQLRLLEGGNLVLNTPDIRTNNAYAAYYISGTGDELNTSNSGFQVRFNESGYMYILRKNGGRFDLTPSGELPSSGYYHRAILNFDGVFIQYYHPKNFTGRPNWTAVWTQPDNICVAITELEGSGACGFNSVCRPDDNKRPICECPKGYSLVHPDDKHGDCKPSFSLSCEDIGPTPAEDLYDFEELIDTDWPYSDYEQRVPISESDCRRDCLHDCFCSVAIYRGNSCWKKKLPLSNGRKDISVNGKALLKVKKGVPSNDSEGKIDGGVPSNISEGKIDGGARSNSGMKIGIGIGAAILGILLICAVVLFFKAFRNRRTKEDKNFEDCITEFGSSIPKRYRYSDVKKMTKSFKDELGKGGFGSVYKGILSDNRLVAVKLLNSSKGTGEDFINEVASIGRTSHVNVVALLGFCYERKKRALIYEFMPNGSLDKFIYRENQLTTEPTLGWKNLYDITLGIARGLEYLHRGCSTRILHLDIKPNNILLDREFCPKISDFGLAKVYSGKEIIVSMKGGRGTFGYAAPEVGNKNFGGVSHKSDVYSFGVMVLEMVGGRKNLDVRMIDDNPSQIYFLEWIYKRVELDEDLSFRGEMTVEETEIAKKMIIVAFWCMQQNPSQRPSMNKVIEMLEGNLEALQLPPKP